MGKNEAQIRMAAPTSSSSSTTSTQIQAPVFGDPARNLRNRLQAALLQPSSGQLPVVNTQAPGYVPYVPPPVQGLNAQQIENQNAVIRRLENDLAVMFREGSEETAKRQQIAKIREHMRSFPGTTSNYVDEFENVLNGFAMSKELENIIAAARGGARKNKKTRKNKRKGKGKAKKSHHRRHHSKSK